MKLKKSVFFQGALRQIHWLLLQMLTAYVLTKVVVKGNELIANAIDTMFAGKQVVFSSFALKLLVMVFIGVIAAFVKSIAAGRFGINVQTSFRNNVIDKLVKLEYKYFDEKGSGSIINKLISDLGEASRFFSETLPDMCSTLITIIIIALYIAKLNFKLFLIVMLCYPVLLIVANKVSKMLAKLAKERRSKIDLMTSIASDSIQGIVVQRSYNLLSVMVKRLNKAIDDILKNEYSRVKMTTASWVLQNLITWIPSIISYVFALYQVLHGAITVGELMAFTILLNRLVNPMGELPFMFNEAREIGVSMHRLEEIMAQEDEASGEFYINNSNMNEIKNVIEFQKVDFSYSEERTIFSDLSFKVENGKTTAFVGSSGGGKSTTFKIISGFYKQQCGDYLLYGENFEKWNLQKARDMMSIVSQNVFLFPDKIAENVAYGKKGATLEDVKEACKRANIHNFIENLPDGYDTLVGERGVRLSGGERQRISIARAFLKDAPILLLDEPTSAIDVTTEHLIKDAIEKISKNKTVIIIAHRLSTIQNADKIFVFAHGSIAEEGTHSELLKNGGVYSELYSKELLAAEEDSKIEVAASDAGVLKTDKLHVQPRKAGGNKDEA
jgi:ABC-type multidrug transport system fused ATPase/permease subunit